MKNLKKIFILIIFISLLFTNVKLFAYISGSPHDFSGAAGLPAGAQGEMDHGAGEICKVCHTPHSALSTEVPLWRGSLGMSGWSGTNVTYILYSSDTLDAAVSQPLAPSKACLTCHDGAIATGPATGCTACHKNFTGSGKNTILNNDHPISFIYDTALAQKDAALYDPGATAVPILGGKTIREGMLYQGRMECTSCHDVHAKKGDSATVPKLLLVNNNQDKLCLTCHNK